MAGVESSISNNEPVGTSQRVVNPKQGYSNENSNSNDSENEESLKMRKSLTRKILFYFEVKNEKANKSCTIKPFFLFSVFCEPSSPFLYCFKYKLSPSIFRLYRLKYRALSPDCRAEKDSSLEN